MDVLKEYLLQSWSLILILLAFGISLAMTVFLDKKLIKRMYFLIGTIFVLSVVVFIEFYVNGKPEYKDFRTVLTAIRYSATPLIIVQVMYTLVKKNLHWLLLLPALILLVLNIVSIFTGIVFSINEANKIVRGPLGLSPFIMVGLYGALLIFLLLRNCNKRVIEIIPIVFLAFALGSGLVLPFILGDSYAKIFCVTIAIALFAYYEFSMHEATKKDSLTGLLNRQAYYAEVGNDPKSITALISIDMNGLKEINDNMGHLAGDEALATLSACFVRSIGFRQSAYRTGGDEFVIACRKTFKDEVLKIVERIQKLVNGTNYSCSIGYSFNFEGDKTIDELLTESDAMMYANKDKYYREFGKNRRKV